MGSIEFCNDLFFQIFPDENDVDLAFPRLSIAALNNQGHKKFAYVVAKKSTITILKIFQQERIDNGTSKNLTHYFKNWLLLRHNEKIDRILKI